MNWTARLANEKPNEDCRIVAEKNNTDIDFYVKRLEIDAPKPLKIESLRPCPLCGGYDCLLMIPAVTTEEIT